MTTEERFQRLEERHVRLVAQHEVFVQEQERSWESNRQSWAEHKAWLKDYDARCERDRQERKELDKRIADLVSGIGEYIRRSK